MLVKMEAHATIVMASVFANVPVVSVALIAIPLQDATLEAYILVLMQDFVTPPMVYANVI
jgi:hypothetical protein